MKKADRLVFIGSQVAKPRMTRSDKWKTRPVTSAYWAFKDAIVLAAKEQNFELDEVYRAEFHLEMPKSWSDKKKKEFDGKPHKSRPDLDNLIKSVNDCLLPEDSCVFYFVAVKKWAYEGKLILENFPRNLDF